MAYTNSQVVDAFKIKDIKESTNLRSTGQKLMSYNTCIAEQVGLRTLFLNQTHYSNSTAKHQCLINNVKWTKDKTIIINLYEVPQDTNSLVKYFKSKNYGV